MEVAVVIAIVGFAFGAALVQSTIGFGYSLLFAPLAALIVGPREAIALSLVTAVILSAALFWEHRPRAPLSSIAVLVVAGIVGTPLGLVMLVNFSEVALHLLVGVGIVISAVVGLTRRGHHEVAREAPVPATAAAGLVSGVMRGAMSFPGPPIVLYEHWVGGSPHDIRGRLFAYYIWTAVPGIAMAWWSGVLTNDVWSLSLAGVPAIVAAVLLARITRRYVSLLWFRRLSMILLIVASTAAVAGAIAEWQQSA